VAVKVCLYFKIKKIGEERRRGAKRGEEKRREKEEAGETTIGGGGDVGGRRGGGGWRRHLPYLGFCFYFSLLELPICLALSPSRVGV
jgi:hypothetical protein